MSKSLKLLVIRGDLNSYSGYTRATSLYLEWVERFFDVIVGVDIHGHPSRYVEIWPYPLIHEFQIIELAARPNVEAHVLTVSTPDNFRRYVDAKRNVGLFFWETTRMGNPEWVSQMNQMDEIWVPTRFMKPMLEREGVHVPVQYTPCPVSRTEPPDEDSTEIPRLVLRELSLERGVKGRTTTLDDVRASSELLLLSTNTFIPRKGFPVLMEEWLRVAREKASVSLILKVSSIDPSETADELLGRVQDLFVSISQSHSLAKSRAFVLVGSFTASTMKALERVCDAFVTLSYGEGLGLGVFDSLLAGKPVLCPKHTSFEEFLPSDYPYFLDTEVNNYGLPDPVGVYPISARWGVVKEGALRRAVDKLVADSATAVSDNVRKAVDFYCAQSLPRPWEV